MTAPATVQDKVREDLARDYGELFRMPSGAFGRVFKRILLACGPLVSVLPDRSEPGNQIYVNAGQQELGQGLIREVLEVAPEAWFEFYKREIKDLMLKEKR